MGGKRSAVCYTPRVRRIGKALAGVVLLALLSTNGAGLLLAYAESDLSVGEQCQRTCCRLSRTGSGYAASCCAVRCGKDVSETGSEPARERSSLAEPPLVPASPPASDVALDPGAHGHRRNLDRSQSHLLVDGQPDLNVQHSVFLV